MATLSRQKDAYEPFAHGHYVRARKLVAEDGLCKLHDLINMTDHQVTDLINKNYKVFSDGDDFILVPLNEIENFNKMVRKIDR